MSNHFTMWRDPEGNPVQAIRLGSTTATAVAAGSAKSTKLVGASAYSLIRVAMECSGGRANIAFGNASVSATVRDPVLLPGVEVFTVKGSDGDEDYVSIAPITGTCFVSYTVVEG
jgi:hypothetical protein